MGEAIITIKTYKEGQRTNMNYIPKEINPYTVIGALQQLIRNIEANIDKTGTRIERECNGKQ